MSQDAETRSQQSSQPSFLMRKLPYLAAFVLACFGVAYTGMSHQTLCGYWEFLALVTGVACVGIGWNSLAERSERLKLMWRQALHWGAFLVAMNILVIAHACFLTAILARLFGNLTGESGADSSFG